MGPFDEPLHQQQQQPPQKRHPKLFHKKSRTGCMRCRERRVKCDEGKPICANCTRLELHCEYGGVSSRTRSNNHTEPNARSPSHIGSNSSQASPAGDPTDPPESAVRRRLELELLYHYATETGPSIPTDGNSAAFWGPVMCRHALKSDAVLYTVCLLAAIHKAHIAGITDMDSVDDISTYLSMAIREHHKDVTNLHPDNVDHATLASNGLRLYSLVRLQHRSLAPYTPPIDWLRVTGTSNIVFKRAYDMVQDRPDSISLLLLSNAFQLMSEKKNHKYLEELSHLLRREEAHELEEFWSDEVDNVYKSTLSIIGAVWKFRRIPEPPSHLARRLIIFPMIVDHQFIDYVEEQRPRALVILAHYFALLNMLRRSWHIGNAGFREAWAIVNIVPPEWNEMLRDPIDMLENPAGYGEVTKTSLSQESPLSRH